jgi:hypothetical protein
VFDGPLAGAFALLDDENRYDAGRNLPHERSVATLRGMGCAGAHEKCCRGD